MSTLAKSIACNIRAVADLVSANIHEYSSGDLAEIMREITSAQARIQMQINLRSSNTGSLTGTFG
jgi:hypothetical protein